MPSETIFVKKSFLGILNLEELIDNKDIKEVVNTLKSNFVTQGPKILEFEKKTDCVWEWQNMKRVYKESQIMKAK